MAVVKPQDYQSQLASWRSALSSGSPGLIATRARELAEAQSRVDTDFHFTVCDFMWRPVGMLGSDLIDASGTDPRNNVGTARIKVKGDSPLIDHFMGCRSTMVGIIMETAGLRFPFYVKVHRYTYEKGAWTGVLECKSIWSILEYLTIWPSWALPIQTQPFSHAVFMWGLCTAVEAMVSESAMRIQAGFTEFINNALSLNPDMRAWWGTVTQALKRDGLSVNTFRKMLRTPIYVKRTNPFLDASPVAIRTVRMETCAQVIRDVTRAYGVDTSMDLWLPGDPQPDKWAKLSQPTYVFSTKDRSQITGPTKTVKDAVIRTVVDLGGSMGVLSSLIKEVKGFDGVFKAPKLGVDFEPPWAILVAPDGGNDGSVISAEIADHTPEGWQHIVGGRSPKWVGAPRLTTGGHRPTGLTLTERSDERNVFLDAGQPPDHPRIHRRPQRPALRVPQQCLPGVRTGAAVLAPRRDGPLSPGHRAVPCNRVGPVQRRNAIRVYQCVF